MTAYVLIQKRVGSRSVKESLRAMPAIVEAEDLTGPYDAIALASADSSRDLYERVIPEIRDLPGVTQVLPAPLGGARRSGSDTRAA